MSMNCMKWSVLIVVVALVSVLVLGASGVMAADAGKTITGKASCGHCSGVVAGGCCVLLTDKDGGRWVLKGKSESLKTAFNERKSGKTMTATLAGKPVTKTGEDGKEYMEVKVSEVKVGS
jgi:hypothetical protein